MDIKSTLKTLTEQIGVSGDEFAASNAAATLLKQYADNVETDIFGNVTGIVSSKKTNAKTLMLDAHIDKCGFVRFAGCENAAGAIGYNSRKKSCFGRSVNAASACSEK